MAPNMETVRSLKFNAQCASCVAFEFLLTPVVYSGLRLRHAQDAQRCAMALEVIRWRRGAQVYPAVPEEPGRFQGELPVGLHSTWCCAGAARQPRLQNYLRLSSALTGDRKSHLALTGAL